jgi:hypothetical protein
MFLASYKELSDEEFIRKFRDTDPWLELMHMTTQNISGIRLSLHLD